MRTRLLGSVTLLLASGPGGSAVAAQGPVRSGILEVQVTQDGAPVPSALVCVGTDSDLNLYFQGSTDAMGIARVNGVPRSAISDVGVSEYRFGAIGSGCGEVQPGIQLAALCAAGHCSVNGGSWEHDQCCYEFPHGMACRRGPLDVITGNGGHCTTEWNKALRLTRKGLFWGRAVDFSVANTTGRVNFSGYCAPGGTFLPPEDAAKCCSRGAPALTIVEQASTAPLSESLLACRPTG